MAHLELDDHGNILVAALTGELTLANATEVRNELERLFARKGVSDVVLDLGAVSFMDSSGLGTLVAASTKARSMGRRLLLYRPTPEAVHTMETAQLTGFFPILGDEEDLLALLPD
ncbi:STAS domain-containing protein [Nitratidesulfovibrio sp. D1]|jgi:anti-sigma B factor antagonist|uniref:STAS domain-containing protein n=1 Tax=Nitratidesulfovibrio sp. D1 TaxID=3440151 RepID=UPI003EBCFB9C